MPRLYERTEFDELPSTVTYEYCIPLVRNIFSPEQFRAMREADRFGYVSRGSQIDGRSFNGLVKRGLIDRDGWITSIGIALLNALKSEGV